MLGDIHALHALQDAFLYEYERRNGKRKSMGAGSLYIYIQLWYGACKKRLYKVGIGKQ